MPPNTMAGADRGAILPVEVLRLLAGRLPLLVLDLLGADVHRGGDEHADRHDGDAEAGVQHRGALAVRVLPFGVEQVAGPGDDAAEDGLNLHRARAVMDLDLGAGARRAREGRGGVRLLLGRGARMLPAAAARTAAAAGARRPSAGAARSHRRAGGPPPHACGAGVACADSASPNVTMTRQSPNITSSPDCSRALVTRSPLTVVPRVDRGRRRGRRPGRSPR